MKHSDIKSIPENKIKNSSNKIDSLQVVRAIAFIIIFISHCNSAFPGEIVPLDFQSTKLHEQQKQAK